MSSTTSSSLPPFLTATLSSSSSSSAPSTARLHALYASTSAQRLSNPTGYTANATWWAAAIQEALRSGWIGAGDAEGDRLVLKVDEGLLGRLEWDGKRPRGIGGVVEREATSAPPKLYPLAAYMAAPSPISTPPSAATRFIARPLWWAVSQLNPFGGEREVREEDLWKAYGKGREYVHVPLVENAAAKFVAYFDKAPLTSYTDSLYDHDTFRRVLGHLLIPDPPVQASSATIQRASNGKTGTPSGDETPVGQLSKRDVQVLVKWLMRDMGVVVTDGTLIKVLEPGATLSENPVDEVDKGALSVKLALEKVELQIESIEKQIERCQAKAKSHLAASQRPLAMSQLRSKKALEDILLRRAGVSEQLRAVIRSIDEAQNDADVMRAYEASTASLRTLLSSPLLSSAHVEKTTEDLAEALADQKEIDDAIMMGGKLAVSAGMSGTEVDEDELEKELEGLVQDEKDKAAAVAVAAETAKAEQQRAAERQRALATAKERDTSRQNQAEQEVQTSGPPSTLPSTSDAIPAADSCQANQSPSSNTSRQPVPSTSAPASTEQDQRNPELAWAERHAAAQQREKEERARAEMERLKREEKRIAEAA